MKKYEYRAWLETEKRFVAPFFNGKKNKWFSNLEFLGDPIVNIEEYTGLQDVNGNKIFEGDFVRPCEVSLDRLYLVVWLESAGAFMKKNVFGNTYTDLSMVKDYYQVVGNVHEDRDLNLYTVADLSKKINLSESRIRSYLCYKPEMVPKREDLKGKVRFNPDVVDAWIAKKQKQKEVLPYQVTSDLQKKGYIWGLQALIDCCGLTLPQLEEELNKRDAGIAHVHLLRLKKRFPKKVNTSLLLAMINVFQCEVDDFFVDGEKLGCDVVNRKPFKNKVWEWEWGFDEVIKLAGKEELSFRELAKEIEQRNLFTIDPGYICRIFKTMPKILDTDILLGFSRFFHCKPGEILRIK